MNPLKPLFIIAIVTSLLGAPSFAQPPARPGYTVSWWDDFNGNSVDESVWIRVDTNFPTNNSLQDYLPQQCTVRDGNLVLTSENNPSRGLPYRSGQVISHSRQQYGRWEVRAKLPTSKGMWPAIWLLPPVGEYPWPSQGEIDIMENRGDEPLTTSSAFHYGTNPPFSHDFLYQEQQTWKGLGPIDYHAGFHVYAVEWDPDQIRYYIDGEHYYTVLDDSVGGFISGQTAGMQTIINTAVGGNFLQNPDGSTIWPQEFLIDYVYVYQKNGEDPLPQHLNPGFENDNGSLENWGSFGNTDTNVQISSQHVESGSWATKIFGQFNNQTNYSGITQGLSVNEGQDLTAKASVFVANDDPLTGNNQAFLKIDYFSKRYAAFGSADYLGSESVVLANSGTQTGVWHRVTLTDNAPQGAVEARLAIVFEQRNNASGAIHVDNASIEGVPVSLTSWSEDFESLNLQSATALSDSGWLTFGLVFDDNGVFQRSYGPQGAPNSTADNGQNGYRFSLLAAGEGASNGAQGNQQLVTFSDYNNPDHGNSGWEIESAVYREQIIGVEDVGSTWEFKFDAKIRDLASLTTANGFIKVVDPDSSFAVTAVESQSTLGASEWTTFSVAMTIDESMVGQLVQVGFDNRCGGYNASGMLYDNLNFDLAEPVDVSPTSLVLVNGLNNNGDVNDLVESDNVDYSARRNTLGTISRVVFTLKSTSPTLVPTSLDFTLEGSVFARTAVNQTIELFDYDTATWVAIDTRQATRFVDSTVTASADGDLARFIDDTTSCIEARISYRSLNNRQTFSANVDQAIWTVGR